MGKISRIVAVILLGLGAPTFAQGGAIPQEVWGCEGRQNWAAAGAVTQPNATQARATALNLYRNMLVGEGVVDPELTQEMQKASRELRMTGIIGERSKEYKIEWKPGFFVRCVVYRAGAY